MTLILDSSLRDGAYAFGNSMPMSHVSLVSKSLDGLVDFIEVGSSLSFGYGHHLCLEEDLIRLNRVNELVNYSKSVVFIQASFWQKSGFPSLAEVFKHTRPHLLRLGIDPEIGLTYEKILLEECRSLNIPYSINLMKSYKFNDRLLSNVANLCNGESDFVSIVDSSGCMSIVEVLSMISKISCLIKSRFSVHIHDNIGHANQISQVALDKGLCIDSTLLGEGRSGGNADTCLMVLQRAMRGGLSLDYMDNLVQSLLAATSPIWGEKARIHLINVLLGLTSLHSSQLDQQLVSSLESIPSIKNMFNQAWKS